MVEVDTNATLFTPLKNRTDTDMHWSYITLLNRIRATGIPPKCHILDNEYSESMKTLIKQHCTIKLVPPHCHQRNVAKVAIKSLKQHFLRIIVVVATDFPVHQWECLLPQDEITLKLLCQSNTTPTVSAYAEMFVPFDYNKIPLGPMGCAVLIYDNPNAHATW